MIHNYQAARTHAHIVQQETLYAAWQIYQEAQAPAYRVYREAVAPAGKV